MDNFKITTTGTAKLKIKTIKENRWPIEPARNHQDGRITHIALVLCLGAALAVWWFAVEQPRREAEIQKQLELATAKRQEEQRKITEEQERQLQALQAREDQERQQRVLRAQGEMKYQQQFILQERNKQQQEAAR